MSTVDSTDSWMTVGQISSVFGIQGQLRIRPFLEQPEWLLTIPSWYLGLDETSLQPFQLLSGRLQGSVVVARLTGITTRNQAETYVGQRVWLPRSSLPALEDPDEFYWCDLIGCQVRSETGVHLGAVTDLMATGANDVLVVHHEDGTERLLPLTAEVVTHIDLQARLITIWLMPGL